MQLFVLALILGILAHDALGGSPSDAARLTGWALLGWVVLPKVAVAGSYHLLCRFTRRRLGTRRGHPMLNRLIFVTGIYRYATLLLFGNDLRVGLLDATRQFLGGDWVAVDELIVIAPTLGMMFYSWFAYYPIDRAMREASLIGRIDAGLPIHPIWTRGQYLLSQWRHQIALMFVPLMLMVAWTELVMLVTTHYAEAGLLRNVGATQAIMIMVGACCVFLFAPVMIRWIWDTTPLPEGELRDRLLRMCRLHRVGVRELLLWRTFGGMINAAVMGLIAPLRYILLSDGLLEMMTSKQVEAVMAHEIAHVRRGHMFWLVAAAMALMMVLGEAWHHVATIVVEHYGLNEATALPLIGALLPEGQAHEIIAAIGTVGCWILAFGWVSRRFERQADTFAVQHLARTGAARPAPAMLRAHMIPTVGGLAVALGPDEPEEDAFDTDAADAKVPTHIDAGSVQIMADALDQVARLNHIGINRRSWRHGSIRWRQEYLSSLIGRRIDNLPIDRQIAAIKLLSAAALTLMGLAAWQGMM